MAVPTIYPSLRYRDAHAAIAWLVRAFGLTENFVVEGPGGTVAHAQLAWGEGGMVMLGSVRGGAAAVETGPAWLYLVVPDPDEHYRRAVAAGAEVVQPIGDKDYGDRGYTVRDLEGHLWSFGTYQPAGR